MALPVWMIIYQDYLFAFLKSFYELVFINSFLNERLDDSTPSVALYKEPDWDAGIEPEMH